LPVCCFVLFIWAGFSSILYVAAMTVFLFRPQTSFLFNADRIAFGVLAFFVALRTMALRDKIPFVAALSLPMLGSRRWPCSARSGAFDAQTWSIIASNSSSLCAFHFAVLVSEAHRNETL